VAAHFANGSPFAINLSPLAEPGTLAQELASRGMRTFFHHVKWLRGAAAPAAVTTRLRVTRVAPADAGVFAAATHAGEEPHRDAQRAWAAAMVGRPGWHHVLAWQDDEAVAGAAVFVEDGAAWLGHARTREAFRRQGAQQALLAERIRIAAEAGATLLTTETAPDWPDLPRESLRNVARAGFRIAYERPSWIRVG
jgi:GNAT superfamily N-acetyltransferase